MRLGFRWSRFGKAAVGGVAIIIVLGSYVALFSGSVRVRKVSPDGRLVAECREYYDASTVEIQKRFNPFRHVVLQSAYDAKLSVRWIDSRNLLVDCGACREFYSVGTPETQWKGVAIHYSPDLGVSSQ
jgi:hypothetical protein